MANMSMERKERIVQNEAREVNGAQIVKGSGDHVRNICSFS